MAGRFNGRTALVTGGANGIGRAIVEAFAREGATACFLDPDGPSGLRLAYGLTTRGFDVLFQEGDVTRGEDLSAFVSSAAAKGGGIDYVVNNACFSRGGILSDCSIEEFRLVLSVGLVAPYDLVRRCRPFFREGAAVVNIASTRGRMSEPDTESYSAAKGGILALTHALAASLGPEVRVNSVSPGWIDTSGGKSILSRADQAQHPAGRVGRPEDIAALVLYLCAAEASFITGQDFVVDGGMTRRMVYHGDGGWEYRP